MKTTTKLALLAIAGLGLGAQSHAVTYTNGDLFLGFRASGGQGATQTYLVDLGQAAIYRDAAEGTSFTLDGTIAGTDIDDIGADLSSIFGASWFSRSDLFWGIAGGVTPAASGDTLNTLYASAAQDSFGISTPWNRRSNSQQGATNTKIQTMATTFQNNYSNTVNSAKGVNEGFSDPNSWGSYQPGGTVPNSGGISFAAFGPSIEGNFANGASGTALDLYRMTTSSTAGLPGSYEGTFSINNSGAVSYTVTPEPTSTLLIGTGLAAFAMRRRRKTVTA